MTGISTLSSGTVVRRLTVTLEDEDYKTLEKIAEIEKRTVANLLAFLGSKAAREFEESEKRPS